MKTSYLLETDTARDIYEGIKNLPICDYHCHLSPKEIYEDREFESIGEMWLSGDHYKWRLMRQAGVPERLITGDGSYLEKFKAYASVQSMAGGNPLYSWSLMELSMYFGIDTPLNESTAEKIFNETGEYIKKNNLSPRKLIKKSGVKYIATTDDPADSLEFHKLLARDKSFDTVVAPTFRTDNVMKIGEPEFSTYIKKLGNAAGVVIDDIGDLRIALRLRLDEFVECGCKFSDLGIEGFPSALYSREEAEPIFRRAIGGEKLTKLEEDIYLGYMYRFLGREYSRHGITMQLHLAAKRDANTRLTRECGRDTGSDCVGAEIDGNNIIKILDGLNLENRLPKTVIYTLNAGMNAQLAPVCASFKGVVQGAAWWYCDHKRGIRDVMETIAETGYFGTFLGMLTDSRSFLSYARHDYFRRILSTLLAQWVKEDDFPIESAKKLAADVSYNNINALVCFEEN